MPGIKSTGGQTSEMKTSDVVVKPTKNVTGTLNLPGDKSISHRYAMLAGIAEGRTKLENFSTGADCASTLACISALGARVKREKSTVTIEGTGPLLTPPAAPLDCGNSGSTIRMLSGILERSSTAMSMFIGRQSWPSLAVY